MTEKRRRPQEGANLVDMLGHRQGLLTVVGRAPAMGNNAVWFCLCSGCGKTKAISRPSLRHGAKSCGCQNGRRGIKRPNKTKVLPSGAAARNSVWKGYQQHSKARGLRFLLTREEFFGLVTQCCYYCGSQPSNTSNSANGSFAYSGLDRVDPSVGYLLDNVVPCCRVCNWAKQKLTLEEFILWATKVVTRHPIAPTAETIRSYIGTLDFSTAPQTAPYHHLSNTAEYRSWVSLKHNIGCCSGWGSSVIFMRDMGTRPLGYRLDRPNMHNPYACGQCQECLDRGWDRNGRWVKKTGPRSEH